MVRAGFSPWEVEENWDVEDIFKFLALRDRENDATAAYHLFIIETAKEESGR